MWPDRRLLNLLNIEVPLIQAPMAGANGAAMAIGACQAGALGSLPCAMLDAAQIRAEVGVIRAQSGRPLNLNFFCHSPEAADPAREPVWRTKLTPYYQELGIDPAAQAPAPNRAPFDETDCALVEELRPQVVSFHFGLPAPDLLARVKAAGCTVLSSATSVQEAIWLEANGCDVIIAQGAEAGGHRAMFLQDTIAGQSGLFALLPQIVDAVSAPVIAAGGIGDGRGIAAAIILGASAVQIGTAYLFTSDATISALHRTALEQTAEGRTALTNLFSGKPARGISNRLMDDIGPMSAAAPPFPTAGAALAPLKAAAEAQGSTAFSSLWSGQAANLSSGRGLSCSAKELTEALSTDAQTLLARAAHNTS